MTEYGEHVQERLGQSDFPLENFIDHAPLFPPAALRPGPAIEAHADALTGPRRVAVNSLVWPLAKLEDIDRLLPDGFPTDRLGLAVLVDSASSIDPRRLMGLPRLRQIELPLNAEQFDGCEATLRTVAASQIVYGEVAPEIYRDPASLASLLDRFVRAGVRAKIRCGGEAPEQIPSSAELGRFISWCVERGLPFKATAGLHHAWPNHAAPVPWHGLANVLLATADARSGADLDAVRGRLFDPTPTTLHGDTLRSARASFVSVGSCSFDEPMNELQNWLARPSLATDYTSTS